MNDSLNLELEIFKNASNKVLKDNNLKFKDILNSIEDIKLWNLKHENNFLKKIFLNFNKKRLNLNTEYIRKLEIIKTAILNSLKDLKQFTILNTAILKTLENKIECYSDIYQEEQVLNLRQKVEQIFETNQSYQKVSEEIISVINSLIKLLQGNSSINYTVAVENKYLELLETFKKYSDVQKIISSSSI